MNQLALLLTALLSLAPGSDLRTLASGAGPSAIPAGVVQEKTPKADADATDEEPLETESDQVIELEQQKELPHKTFDSLGTIVYQPSKLEQRHFEQLRPADQAFGGLLADREIRGRVGQQIGWFGIVRKDRQIKFGESRKKEHHELLIEHKYFDGLTDSHQQIVSFAGGGDFKAILPFDERKLPFKTLTLVRCYGEVISEKKGIPTVELKFIRVWPWNNFAFMDLGSEKHPDRTNKAWRKRLKIPEQVYSPAPDTRYYEKLLGKQKR